MAYIKFDNVAKRYTGQSTDDRTSTTYDNGAKLYLTDTGETLVYLNGNWHDSLKIDMITHAPRTITTDHSSIHESEGFNISGIFTGVANLATVNYAFKTPTVESGKIIHYKYHEFWASANKVRTDFYEAPTDAPINGTDLTAYNRNRIAATPTATTMQAIKVTMDATFTGAKDLETLLFGITPVVRSMDIEFVLKPDTWYIRTFTNSTGGAVDINFFEFWYEDDVGGS